MHILLLFLGVLTLAAAETCPPDSEISPCFCEGVDDGPEIIVSCVDSSTTMAQLKQVLRSLSSKRDIVLELDEMKLGTVPHDFFEGVAIIKLEITHCELDSLTDGRGPMLKGLESTLEGLDIQSSFTEDRVPAKLSLSHLTNLVSLDLSYNTITELGNDWFENGPTSLMEMVISNNGIEKIGDRVFEKLENLESLSLDGNRFGGIERSMFPRNAEKLETLELDNNALTSIPEDLFSNMPNLQHISLRTNGISRLEKNTWFSAWRHLQEIHLEGNPLECDDHLNWLFHKDMKRDIYGMCHSPQSRYGLHLIDLIELKLPRH